MALGSRYSRKEAKHQEYSDADSLSLCLFITYTVCPTLGFAYTMIGINISILVYYNEHTFKAKCQLYWKIGVVRLKPSPPLATHDQIQSYLFWIFTFLVFSPPNPIPHSP